MAGESRRGSSMKISFSLGVEPGLAAQRHIRPLLLGGVRGFF